MRNFTYDKLTFFGKDGHGTGGVGKKTVNNDDGFPTSPDIRRI